MLILALDYHSFNNFNFINSIIMKFLLFLSSFLILSTMTAQTNSCNCCTEKYAEFDFWVGEWEVTQPNGTPAGSNRIEKVQGNCMIREHWTSAKGSFTGTSTNFFNIKTNQWEQLWIDNQGQSLHLKGNRIDNQMILQSDEAKDDDGNRIVQRITWTKNEDGTVRQYWETIINDSDITVAFDGLYKKK